MEIVLPLAQMSMAEKLSTMEALWADLSHVERELDSPAWHREVLEEREQRIASGTDEFIKWELAKKQLREKLM